ncbi:hypothetical protein F0562_019973 [Nyssa sinensis]|uniref:SANT domain-containing protein n=1 Tax=Nyssa sinensis TaxID=561372 RepID=A0A5J5BQK8_9ASTE|nr:hypothetical protein F0562_019973 [Nyssa sinensis]
METDSFQLDHIGMCVNEMFPEQLPPPDSPEISYIFGDPQVLPRVGDEYQVEIPPMITESEHLQLLKNPTDMEVTSDVSYSFLMGLPIPLIWIDDELKIHRKGDGFNNTPDDSVKTNGSLGSNISKKSQLNSNKRGLQGKVESSDVGLENGEELKSPNFEHTLAGKANLDQMYRSKRSCLVPGLLDDCWSDFEVDSFLLGLYIFKKNFVQVKRFMESKTTGEIMSFYYCKFYRSDGYRRWSYCRKMKSKKCIFGYRIFTGWRQQELLSRLFPHVPKEGQNILVEVLAPSLSDESTYWHGFLACKDNVPLLDSVVKIHPKTFRDFNIETPTIQLLYLDTICGYIRSYGRVRVRDLDDTTIWEFQRVFRDFAKAGIDISWFERHFDACMTKQSSIAVFDQMKEAPSRCMTLAMKVQDMSNQLAELEQALLREKAVLATVEVEENRLAEECREIQASMGDINDESLVLEGLF